MSTCVNCGFDSDKVVTNKPITHTMNRYVNEKDSKDITILNDDRSKVVTGEKTWILESISKVAAQAQIPVKIVPTTPAPNPTK